MKSKTISRYSFLEEKANVQKEKNITNGFPYIFLQQ